MSNLLSNVATAATFECLRDHDRDDHRECFNIFTRFIADRVNCCVRNANNNASYAHIVADRGFLLLHRETHDNSISLSIFTRDKTNDAASPDLKIPIGLIASIAYAEVESLHGTFLKGQIDLTTHCTVDAKILPGPLQITTHMGTAEMYQLQSALHIANKLWTQHERAFFVPKNL